MFSLVLGSLFGLQIFNLALIFHPMSVRVSAAHADERPVLLGSSLILLLLLSLGLSIVLGTGLLVVRRPDL